MKRIIHSALVTLLLASAVCAVGIANAATLDLTTVGASGILNGALFQQVDTQSTGSGVIDSFVRIQANGIEEGYNTDYRHVEFDEHTTATFNHSLNLSSVPIVKVYGVDYREFLLDVNESTSQRELSLDKLELYLLGSGNLHNYASFGTPIYTLDPDPEPEKDNWIKLDYSLNSGSGSGDMFAYIPNSFFTGPNQYVYLYSRFGDNISTNAGFEEWALVEREQPPIPEPSGVLALLIGLVGVGGQFRRRTS